jgi:Mrp family chromosome partitioning ATPase
MGVLIAEWNLTYKFILVDIPPLLLSADAEIMAHNLEHLVIVVEASGITTDELRRAGRQVEKLTPAAVGVVVNRVRPFNGGGYLRDMLFEHLTGRKSAKFFVQPSWRISLNVLLSRLPNGLFKFFSRNH